MRNTFNQIISGKRGRLVGIALAAGAAGAIASPALAGPRDRYADHCYDDRWDHHEHHDDRAVRVDVDLNFNRPPRYEERQTRVWVEPVYRTVCDRVWVEPVYKTVCDRVWHEPVVRTECERVWVPACFEVRTVTRRDECGRPLRVRERVEVAPGHFEERRHEVVVRPGYYETVERRELACDGHWDTVERRELVCDGHYEWRTERVKVADSGRHDEGLIGFGFDLR